MLSTVDRIARVAMICDACVLSKNIRIRDVKGMFIDCDKKLRSARKRRTSYTRPHLGRPVVEHL